MADPVEIAPTVNPVGNGLVNNPVTQPTLPPLTPVAPIAPTTAVNATPGLASATGYTATPYNVRDSGLVQQRVLDLVKEDSPLMQQARQHSLQEQNARGLVNSSIAVTAGQNAVIGQALPIASADAQSINTADWKTADAQNRAAEFGAGAENTVSGLNAQLESSMNAHNATAQNSALAATAQAENVRMLSVIDNNTKQALAVLDTQNRQLLQTNANAANMFQETVKNIAAISVNDTMSRAAKDAAVATQINLLNQGLQTTGGIAGTVPSSVQALNLGQYFQPATAASYTPAQKAQQVALLDQQLVELKAHLKDVAQNGTGVPILQGPDASERRKPLWDAAVSDIKAQITTLENQRKTYL